MGERLLCKQEVVGSIPSASMAAGCGRVVTESVRVRIAHGVSLPLGGAWRGVRGSLVRSG